MPSLDVPGAVLHYDSFGSGPLILFITGADGRAESFHKVAQLLADHFTAVCYDRRGYSKSLHKGSQDLNNRLSIDADDAHLLIEHLSPGQAAFAFGSSSGAIVAQRLLERHPGSVKKLFSHEPPAFALLPEEYRLQASGLMDAVYDTYRAHGTAKAIDVFTTGFANEEDGPLMRDCMDSTRGHDVRANAMFWFEFELKQYTSSPVDLEILGREKEKFVPAAGIKSGGGPGVGPIAVISQVVGKDIVRFPGGHLGFMTVPEEFTNTLKELLA